ncbi:MAG: hypothetical protein J7M34_06030 [Anaerolineae bacterium]|nr:hypothetical protein [Anaerolineae bacterium]
MALRQILDALSGELATALGCSVVKGLPSWGRPGQSPPVVAVLFAGWEPSGPPRIGASRLQGITQTDWQIYVFGRNEAELLDLIDKVTSWLSQTEIGVNGERMRLQVFGISRYESQTGAQQEQYGAFLTLSVTGER